MPIPEPKSTILVVDDLPENLRVLNAVLKGEHIVRVANSGQLALRLASCEPMPDLILLDIMMPDMDGYEVIRQLKADEATRDIPVIFVTALAEMDDELKGLQLGAVDYITKPFSVPIVRARVRTQLELRCARARLAKKNNILMTERQLIEETVALMRDAHEFDGRHLRWLSTSVDQTNGDTILAGITRDGRQWLLVGDVAGHGPVAALGVPMIAEIFYRRLASNAAALSMLNSLNVAMCLRLPPAIYMSHVFVEVSADRRQAHVWHGGLPGCALIAADGGVTPLAPTILALGITHDTPITEQDSHRVDLPPGSRLCLFTDGITELCNAEGSRLGAGPVLDFMARLGPADDINGLWPVLEGFYGGRDYPDDMTVVELSQA